MALLELAEINFDLKNFSKAEKYYRNLASIEKSINGEKTANYLALLENIAGTSIEQSKTKQVDSIYQKVIPLVKEINGDKSMEYALVIKRLADLQKNSGKFKEAETNYLEAKLVIKNSQGIKHQEYLNVLNSLALMYNQQRRLSEAEAAYNEMAEILKDNNGVKSKEYGAAVSNLAKLYKAENKFDQAEKLYERTLKAYKSAVGEKNILYINALVSMGVLYRNMGQYNKAETIFGESKKLFLDNIGEKNIDYANLVNHTALLYEETGRYDLAEQNYKYALTIIKDLVTEKHESYAAILNNLAHLNKNLGHYEQAEPMYKQALSIRKEVLGENHTDYGASLNNLAEFYESLSRTKEALPLYIQASQITKAMYGEQHHEYALSLNNLANIYDETEQYEKAEQHYNQSLVIMKNVLGETHAEYASTLHNLAFLYLDTKKYKEAETLFKKDLEIIRTSLGLNHPNYAKALSNLGGLYEHMGKYPEAEKNYLESARIRKEKLGDHHPDYTYTLASLARVYTAINKYTEASNYWKMTIVNYKEEIRKYFPSMSEREKEEFYKKFADRFEQYNSFASMRFAADPTVLSEMYNTQLATKAILFNSSNKVRQRIMGSNDLALIESFKKWQSAKEYLAQLYVLPKSDVKINLDSLEQKTNELEKELSLKSELFKTANDAQSYTWQDVQKTLKPGEAAVEMIRFRKYKADMGGTYVQYNEGEGKQLKDSVYYAALIITPETKNNPQIVLLKNGMDLETRYIIYYRNTIKFNLADEFCYANYWNKIATSIPGTKKVYFSPDGIYNNINILSIYNPATKKYVIDEIDIQNVTNTKDLITAKPIGSASKKIVLMGDPDFGTHSGTASFRSGQLKRLPGSGEEVKKIATVVNSNNWAGSLYIGAQSSEEQIKNVKDVKILHIATHGFFEPDPEKSSDRSGDNPLLRSGLYLSGSSKETGEDGKLTAYEAMNLSLDNTEMVVLSACETGLGTVKNGEGVYGIQRAFRVAGARSIIISLWKVDDIATQKLMVMFYEEWLKSGNKRQAFTSAQNKLRNEYKDPMYWGAFIIVGE
jgi:tetratricopeptide (TPR) repeat protein